MPEIVFPEGVTEISSPIVVADNTVVRGAGSGLTTLRVSSNAPMSVIQLNGHNSRVEGLTIDGGGANHTGIAGAAATYNNVLSDIIVQNCGFGFDLTPTAYGTIENCTAQNNVLSGFYFYNLPDVPAMQWNLINTLALNNGGCGYVMEASAPGYATSGQWLNTSSFGNAGGGFLFKAATGGTLNDVRLMNINASTDGGHEVEFVTSGEHHIISGGLIEGSKNGSGIVASGNNLELILSALSIRSNACDGVGTTEGLGRIAINGCMISDNNQGGTIFNGITIGGTGTNVTMAATQSWGARQKYGLWSNAVLTSASACSFERIHVPDYTTGNA